MSFSVFGLPCAVILLVASHQEWGVSNHIAEAADSRTIFNTALSFAKEPLEDIQGYLDDYKDSGKQLTGTLMKLSKSIKPMLSILKGSNVIAGIIFDFILAGPDPMEEIMDRLDEVKDRLEDVMGKLSDMTDEIIKAGELSDWLALNFNFEQNIRNGAKKLKEIRKELSRGDIDIIQRQKLAKEFTDYFENNDIEGNMNKMFQLTGGEETITTKNLFKLLKDNHNCNVNVLSQFMIILKTVMTLGGDQLISYRIFKDGNVNRAQENYKEFVQQLFTIRSKYDGYTWDCISRTIEFAEKEAEKIKTEKANLGDNTIAKLYGRLSKTYTFYSWIVIAADKFEHREYCGDWWQRLWKTYFCGNIIRRGEQYFETIYDNDKRMIVAWQHGEEIINCNNRLSANTVVHFKPCEDCSKRPVKGKAILTQNDCTGIYQTPLKVKVNKEMNKFQWTAVGETHDKKVVRLCSGNGINRQIPHSSKSYCECNVFYDGENCEQSVSDQLEEKFIKLIADLREVYGETQGVPNVINVYHTLLSLQNQIKNNFDRVRDRNEWSDKLIQYSDEIQRAHYITSIYTNFLNGSSDIKAFVLGMNNGLKHNDIAYIMKQVNDAILGTGLLDDLDILFVYKKAYISKYGEASKCTQRYVSDMSRMRRNLAGLDELLTEALVTYSQYMHSEHGAKLSTTAIGLINKYAGDGEKRQRKYNELWSKSSCGEISSNEMTSVCGDKDSFQGMSVELKCEENMKPLPSSITCIASNASLTWNPASFRCALWGEWSVWTCGGKCGEETQRRTRKKYNSEEIQHEEKPCQHSFCRASSIINSAIRSFSNKNVPDFEGEKFGKYNWFENNVITRTGHPSVDVEVQGYKVTATISNVDITFSMVAAYRIGGILELKDRKKKKVPTATLR